MTQDFGPFQIWESRDEFGWSSVVLAAENVPDFQFQNIVRWWWHTHLGK